VQLTCVAAGELPAEVGVVTFFGRTVNVEDGLRTSIDESSCFECLNASMYLARADFGTLS